MSSNELLTIYQQILGVAEAIKDNASIVGDVDDVPLALACNLDEGASHLSSLVLPLPPSIEQSLTDGGVEHDTAQRLSSAYDRAINKLKEEIETSFQKAWSQAILTPRHPSMLPLKDLHSRLSTTHAHLFQRKTATWASEVRQRAFARRALTQGSCETMSENTEVSQVARPFFNTDYLPVLEAFFAEERFPSRADKLFLAKKSGMSYRQIHVWFQNRRSRMGKPTSLIPDRSDSAAYSPHSEETDVDDDSIKDSSSRSSSFTLVADEDPFAWTTPPHAFPTKYPPDFDTVSDPFHCRFGDFTGFPKVVWRRTLTPRAANTSVFDLPSLIEAFEKLSIGSNHPPIQPRTVSRKWGLYIPRLRTGYNVNTPYITFTHQAPLASLVRIPAQCKALRPCTISCPSYCNSMIKPTEALFENSQVMKSGIVSWEERDNAGGVVPSSGPALMEKRGRAKGRKKLSGPPRRIPKGRPISETHSETLRQSRAQEGQRLYTSMHDKRSNRVSLSKPSPSLSSTISSRSSSESHSPVTPILDFSDENLLFSAMHSEATTNPSSTAPPKSLSEGVRNPLFSSEEFIFDDSLLNLPTDDSFNIAFGQLNNSNLFPLTPHEPAIPTQLPFSFDFSSLAS